MTYDFLGWSYTQKLHHFHWCSLMSGMYIEVLADTNPPFERIPSPPEVEPLLEYNPLWKNDLKNDRSLTWEGIEVVKELA